jgi:hypothetical protein
MRFTQYHAMCPAVVRLTRYHHVSCLWWGRLNIMLCVFPVVRFFHTSPQTGHITWYWVNLTSARHMMISSQPHQTGHITWYWKNLTTGKTHNMIFSRPHHRQDTWCLWWGVFDIILCVLSVVRLTQYHAMCPACGEVDSISCCVQPVVRCTQYHVMWYTSPHGMILSTPHHRQDVQRDIKHTSQQTVLNMISCKPHHRQDT